MLSDGQRAVVNTVAAPSKALIDIPRIADAIENGVNTFMEFAPGLIRTLDGIAQLHPFIGGMCASVPNMRLLTCDLSVAVIAFKALYTLEATRRNNDKKITAIFAEYVVHGSPRQPSHH